MIFSTIKDRVTNLRSDHKTFGKDLVGDMFTDLMIIQSIQSHGIKIVVDANLFRLYAEAYNIDLKGLDETAVTNMAFQYQKKVEAYVYSQWNKFVQDFVARYRTLPTRRNHIDSFQGKTLCIPETLSFRLENFAKINRKEHILNDDVTWRSFMCFLLELKSAIRSDNHIDRWYDIATEEWETFIDGIVWELTNWCKVVNSSGTVVVDMSSAISRTCDVLELVVLVGFFNFLYKQSLCGCGNGPYKDIDILIKDYVNYGYFGPDTETLKRISKRLGSLSIAHALCIDYYVDTKLKLPNNYSESASQQIILAKLIKACTGHRKELQVANDRADSGNTARPEMPTAYI